MAKVSFHVPLQHTVTYRDITESGKANIQAGVIITHDVWVCFCMNLLFGVSALRVSGLLHLDPLLDCGMS